MNLNFPQKVVLGFYLFLVAFWVVLFVTGTRAGFYNYLYSFFFGLVPLIAGGVAISRVHMWGGVKSAVGRAVLFIGIGIFLWGFGETIWSYYNFFMGVPAPYPSLADLGFAPSIFFYGLGSIYLAAATGAKFTLRYPYAKVIVGVSAVALLVISYYILVVIARGGVLVPEGETMLKVILDIAYPLGGFLGLAVSVIVSGLSFKYLGGKYQYDIMAIMAGLACMFLGDAAFSYTTTVGTFYNANIGDLFLTTGTSLLSFGVLGFYTLKTGEKV